MKRGFKRVLSFAVVAAMALGGFALIPSKAEAEESFPTHYDLRDEGVVTPVKLQNPWQNCWSFSGTAAAETSILSLLGISNSEYKALYGEDFDLSEKHLAWYGERPITALTDPGQVGEGVCTFGAETNPQKVYNNGGYNVTVSSLFSSGVGPVFESMFPYNGAEKLTDVQYAEKYPEKAMPSIIEFLVLRVFGGKSFDEAYNELTGQKYPFDENTPDWIKKFNDKGCFAGYDDPTTITKEQFSDICYNYYLVTQKATWGNSYYSEADDWTIPDVNEEGKSNRDISIGFTLKDGNTLPEVRILDADEKWTGINQEGVDAIKSEVMNGHGVSISFHADTSKPGEVETGQYINLNTWAHYTYEKIGPNHAVCIIGWDDNYSADNFNEGHRPPADGAWIVKNSWGSLTDWYDNGTGGTINKREWGYKNEDGLNTGFFYLSYYDQTIQNPETLVFDTDIAKAGGNFETYSHDYMPSIFSFMDDTTVHTTDVIKTANVFKNDSDNPQKLYSVSTKTSAPNSTVKYSIYRVKDKATNPEEGTLLGEATGTYDYKGFHREELDGSIVIMPGESFSIVAEESAMIDGQKKYGFNVNTGLNEETCKKVGRADYCVAVVNPGESFYYNAGKWSDWTEIIPVLKEDDEQKMFEIDNFSIKAYMVSTTSAMYRLYNPNSGEHFYTADAVEKDNVVEAGWTYEGIAWTAPAKSEAPVYRVYNPNSGEHFYTTDISERDDLISLGWRDEGIGWYSAYEDGESVYRLYNPNAAGAFEAGAHFYTMKEDERDILDALGWNYEGIGWYSE